MSNGEIENKRALFVAPRSTGSYGDDPSSSGSGYSYVPVIGLSDWDDGLEQLPTNQQDGTQHGESSPTKGGDGWKFTTTVPILGLAAFAGIAGVPGAADWWDFILAHQFAAMISETGQDVGVGSTTTSLVLTVGTGGLQSLHPVWEAAVPTSAIYQRTQWSVAQDAGPTTFALAPAYTQAPSTAAVRAGTKTYLPSDKGGNDLAFVHRMDGVDHTLLGARLTASKWKIGARKTCVAELTFEGDSVVPEQKASLPPITKQTQPHVVGVKSPVWVNGTNMGTSDVEIDWGIVASPTLSTGGNQGRAEWPATEMHPKIALSPIWSNSIRDLKRNITTGPCLIQIGGGAFDGTRLNTMAVHFAEVFAPKADPKGDQGIRRAALMLTASRMGIFSGTTPARFCQAVRA